MRFLFLPQFKKKKMYPDTLKEMHIKTTVRYHCITFNTAKIKCRQECKVKTKFKNKKEMHACMHQRLCAGEFTHRYYS